MTYNTKKRNTPIATLIKNYINKKSGKVSDSRNEIQRRFDYLDWKDQKKIVLAFLESGKTDRQWAYSKALDYWDKSFDPKIKQLWEQLHEEKYSWVVIRYFPVEYLSQNIDKFTEGRDYYFICLRLAENCEFEINKEKLSNTDYLAVLYHTGRSIDMSEAEVLLYENVHKICLDNDPYFALDRYANASKGYIISPISFKNVSLMLYYLRKLGCSHIVWQFEEWNKNVQEEIFNSPEFKAVSVFDIDEYDYRQRMINIARKYGYLALDEKYKRSSDPSVEDMLKPKEWYSIVSEPKDNIEKERIEQYNLSRLKEMMAKNPAFEKLVEDLGLDLDNSNLPF